MIDPKWSREWDYSPALPANDSGAFSGAVTRLPMWLFVGSNNDRVLSLRPVEVEIYRDGPDEESPESAFIFSCKKLHVFASAVNYKVAEDLFHDQVVHFYRLYREAKTDDLAEDAVEIQNLYKRYFRESPAGG